MSNILELFGIQEKPKADNDFYRTIFYFMKEMGVYPLSEEFEVIPIYDNEKIVKLKVKKQAMDLEIFHKLISSMYEHYKHEEAEMKKIRRR